MNASKTLLAAALLGLAVPDGALAATETFLKLDSIKGESRDATHRDEIAIESWSFVARAEARPGPAAGQGSQALKPCLSDLSLVKPVDRASPALLQAAMLGQRLKDARLAVRKGASGDGKAQDYLVITLKEVVVTSVQQSGGGDGAMEALTLDFTGMRMSYRYDDGSGKPATHVEVDVADCGVRN